MANLLTAKQKDTLNEGLKNLRGFNPTLNRLCGMVIPAVHKGHNIADLNRIIVAGFTTEDKQPTKDRKDAVRILSRFTGHAVCNERLILKGLRSAKAKEAAQKAWAEHLESGMSIRDAMQATAKAKKEKTAEQLKEQHVRSFVKAYNTIKKDGFTLDQLIEIMTEADKAAKAA